ncbi:hypothetical protein BN946_scf184908.g58 [Trametes cinnabarina]|uniref:Uncharacterized protein n=1 Tax=Pycnoporus cinnabarinus TaxID=5643 RepID=A0A060SAT3_PYCCI|nr:hypothetical protein BN946_scf184908.g58 [Trametes cinnabarina]
MKPRPPPPDGSDSSKFPDADKIFFIHYLQWRIRDHPAIHKTELYKELEAQMPRHSADAWQRHWDNNPHLPDRIYIEGRNRAFPPSLRSSATATSEALQAKPTFRERHSPDHSDSGEDESDVLAAPNDVVEELSDEPETVPVAPKRLRGRLRKCPVTEEDLQAMAAYMIENSETWHGSRGDRWGAFAKRPEVRSGSLYAYALVSLSHTVTIANVQNTKRTVTGWAMIEVSHKDSQSWISQLTAGSQRLLPRTELRALMAEYELAHHRPVAVPNGKDSQEPSRVLQEEVQKSLAQDVKVFDSEVLQFESLEEGKAKPAASSEPVQKVEQVQTPDPNDISTARAGPTIPRKRGPEEPVDTLGFAAPKRLKEGPKEGVDEVIILSD